MRLGYLNALETADRMQPAKLEAKTTRLQDKIARLREQMRSLDQIEEQRKTEPDGQLSVTRPDAHSMPTRIKGSGMVGYNVQVAVDARQHLIVAHEVTNSGSDLAQLSPIAKAARDTMGRSGLRAIADRGCYSGLQINECADARIAVMLPRPTTSGAKHHGRLIGTFTNARVRLPPRRLELSMDGTPRPSSVCQRPSFSRTTAVDLEA